MGWNAQTTVSTLGAIVDPASITMNSGRQVDFTLTPSGFKGTDGNKLVPSGTVVSELVSGKVIPRVGNEVTLTTVIVASNVATVTKTNHGYLAGQTIFITGSNKDYVNGSHVILTVPDANTFTYTATGTDVTATGTIKGAAVATGILASNAIENSKSDSSSGYGIIIGGNFYENLLPDATGNPAVLPDAIKAELEAAGMSYSFEQYADTRA